MLATAFSMPAQECTGFLPAPSPPLPSLPFSPQPFSAQPSSCAAEASKEANAGHYHACAPCSAAAQEEFTKEHTSTNSACRGTPMHINMNTLSNSHWDVGAAWVQGFRPSMEDAHVVDLDLDTETGLLGVFDGHGGHHCAEFCANHIGPALQGTTGWADGDLSGALSQAFLAIDEQISDHCPACSGTTSTVALLRGPRIVVAGVGDSKCMLVRAGRAVAMTVDHRPDEPSEEARIRCAGGFVHRGRVNACLNVSRALGDAQFKQDSFRPRCEQQVSPEPDIREAEVACHNDFLLLCSDGVWNSVKDVSVLRFVRQKLLAGLSPAEVCRELCNACLEPCCTAYDNITAILCTFKGGALAKASPPGSRRCARFSLDGPTPPGSPPEEPAARLDKQLADAAVAAAGGQPDK